MKKHLPSGLPLAFALTAIAVGIGVSPEAGAYQVIPLSAVLKQSGPGASATFEIENRSDAPLPIEVSVHNRTQDLEGNDIPDPSADAEEKFIIFPPQLIVDPKGHRSVRISWLGGHKVDYEQSFRAVFQQVSVPTKKEKKTDTPQGKVNFLFDYSASVYVTPEKASPKLVLISAEPDPKNAEKLALLVENQGTAHQIIKGFSVKLQTPDHQDVAFSDLDVGVSILRNVLSKSKLRILVPWPKGVKKGPLKGEFVPKT